ncbi:PREDICTED: probable pectinesterase 53 isoform X1 [Nicotiana attenuata]|uniref:Pectinesterase n=1 Tax=Nicotiana attenuata TaxID=49451 RepID=A0A1J6K0W4_NICAT|nr:PREDICTED: probable pectinesterase 53 isoform X1 [Nicotiana attenuata]OIT23677.1 putative pectinesterase 53 [Nicotiana attenuata]
MATSRTRLLELLFILILFFAISANAKRGKHSRRHNKLKVANEDGFLNWINSISSRNHSVFQEAKNKFEPCKYIKVNKNPKHGDFTTVQEAIDSIPIVNSCRVVISVSPGIYREKIEIPATMAYITLEGASSRKTTIKWDDTADRVGKDGQPMGTYGSATFAVNSPYFIAKNITFKNVAPPPPSGALGKQAVALRISADTAAFINCKFIGAQDTLYDHRGRHYFKNCYIQGSVDFIFGDGLSLYENCHLNAKTKSYGALTAQKRESMLEETGFSFVNCKVTGSGALYLGRAWGTFSRVVFAYTYMDKIITSKGWYDWGDKNRHMTVFYGQFKCSGPGANHGGRVKWSRELTEQEAKPFVSLSFIDGHEWLLNI